MRVRWAWAVAGCGLLGAGSAAEAREPMRLVVTPAAPLPSPPTPVAARLGPRIRDDDGALRVDDPRSRLRSGFGGTLVDLYPEGEEGFHLSAGGRLSRRGTAVPAAAPDHVRALPATTRGPAWRNRFAPALLAGYDRTVADGVSVGVDAGMVAGRTTPDASRLRLDRRFRDNAGANGVARVTMGYRF
jgi:hypothetical protein